MSRECIVAIPKPRKRRTESNVGLESPAAFSTPGVPTTNGKSYMGLSIDPPPPPNRAPTGTFAAVRNQSQDSLLSPPDLRNNGSKSFTALLVKGLRLDSPGIVSWSPLKMLCYKLTSSRYLETCYMAWTTTRYKIASPFSGNCQTTFHSSTLIPLKIRHWWQHNDLSQH